MAKFPQRKQLNFLSIFYFILGHVLYNTVNENFMHNMIHHHNLPQCPFPFNIVPMSLYILILPLCKLPTFYYLWAFLCPCYVSLYLTYEGDNSVSIPSFMTNFTQHNNLQIKPHNSKLHDFINAKLPNKILANQVL